MVFRTCGGDKRDRTADLLNAIQALSQLSYTPIFGSLFGQLLYYSIPAEFVNRFLKNFLGASVGLSMMCYTLGKE